MKQERRLVAVSSPLGEDVLVLSRMSGTEQMGRMFQYDLTLYSEDDEVDFDKLLGQNITLRMETDLDGESPRFFNGFVSRLSQVGRTHRFATYQLTLRPWLWFLTRTSDCRIFQDMNVPDIIRDVFSNHGFNDYDDELASSYDPWTYCVQYRESDFNFVSRLMEQEGIYYYFRHENGKHKLVLSDGYSSHNPIPNYETVPFFPPDERAIRERDHIFDWQHYQEVQPVEYVLNDYNFEKPNMNLVANDLVSREHQGANFQVYDYPGEYTEHGPGMDYSRVRLQELQSQYDQVHGRGDARGLTTGGLFALDEYPRKDQNKEYLIIGAQYEITSNEFESADESGDEDMFRVSFTAIDAQQQYRAPRTTPKPVVQGPQTAVVVGKAGEEIYTDKHARVKVQFHWDRYSKADENSSCWIRVAQLWAGKQWGGMFIPRIGQEVIVEFLEGDPDRPIITGRVYNGSNMPPYELPGNKTRSGVKSNSSKGGGGYNEIRLEDKAGEEQIFVHAQKDKDLRVKNIFRQSVENDKHLTVKNDQFELVEVNKHGIVKGDYSRKVEGNVFDTNESDRIEAIKGNAHQKTDGNRIHQVGGNDNLKVDGNLNEKVAMKISSEAGMDIHTKAGMNYAAEAGMGVHIKGGMTVVIEAGMQLSLKVGGSFVNITPAGVDITGPMIKINSGGAAGSGGGCSPTAPAAVESPDVAEEAVEADNDKAGSMAEAQAKKPPEKKQFPGDSEEVSPMAKALKQAAKDGTPFCEECEKARQEQAAKNK